MAEIIKIMRESVPAMRFIGKKYESFGHWGEMFSNGFFDQIEQAMGGVDSITAIWENGGGYIGLERRHTEEPFEYWLGMFVPINTDIPDGFSSVDFPESDLGICWIYGTEKEVHKVKGRKVALIESGVTIWKDKNGAEWSFENCVCPRYTTPDEKGNVILDYCYFIEKT